MRVHLFVTVGTTSDNIGIIKTLAVTCGISILLLLLVIVMLLIIMLYKKKG